MSTSSIVGANSMPPIMNDDRKFMQFLIPPGKRVLELGCGRGDLLAALKPSYGVGIDFGAETIAQGQMRSIPT